MNALFSNNKLKTCFVKESSSSSMDIFLNSSKENHSTYFPRGKLICFHGPPGSGKTTLVKKELDPYVSLDAEILKTKQGTLDYLERLRSTQTPIVIDDWEAVSELVGIREITGPISPLSPTVFVSHQPVQLTKETVLMVCPHTEDFRRRELGSGMDTFETPKEYVHRLLRGYWKDVKIGDVTHEHGHVWSIIQENYPDRTDDLCEIADLMSDADLIDTDVYDQSDWGVIMPLFTMISCIQPCKLMKSSNKVPRTGSLWTKYQNMCMRHKKLEILLRRSGRRLTRDAIDTVVALQMKNSDFTSCKEYKLEPSDIDVLNHIIGPLKPKIVQMAKKSCNY